MPEIRTDGAEKFRTLARALRQVGDKELQRDLYRGINRAVKPLKADVLQSTHLYLPARYAIELSKSLRVQVRRRAGQNPGVTLRATAKTKQKKDRDLASLNRGRLRHPLYGDRRHWFNQSVKQGFWDEPLEQDADVVRKELVNVIHEVAKKLDRKL